MNARLIVFMDVEDPFGALADDAALDCARLFSDVGVRGSFCVTGEKCRKLSSRRREDVADALRPHALGLHTDTHSVHPTTMEALEAAGWEEGIEIAMASESRGVEAFQRCFGRPPTFWGGAGNTWGPQVAAALARLAIPAYVYALTELPDRPVHRFCGTLAIPQHLGFAESVWQDDSATDAAIEWVDQALRSSIQPLVAAIVGHPTRVRYEAFWDLPYAHGIQPERYDFHNTLTPEGVYHRSLANLGRLLQRFRGHIVGIDEALLWPWSFRPPNAGETSEFKSLAAQNLRGAANWVVHRPGLSVERLVELTLERASAIEVAKLDPAHLPALS